jgi:predicted Rossmann fold nucleotide-binding protein DprA/Smf involved in DNA uptake
VDVDTIIARSGFGAGEALGLLTGLELSGRIEQLPGKMFVLKID